MKTISLQAILKDGAQLSSSSLLSMVINFVKGLIVAKFLDPLAFGQLNLVYLIQSYAVEANPGIIGAAQREMLDRKAKDDSDEIGAIADTGFTAELTIRAVIALLVLGAAPFLRNLILTWGLIITACYLLLTCLYTLQTTMYIFNKNFRLIARLNLLIAALAAILIVLSIHQFGVYGPLVAPLLASAAAILIGQWLVPLRFHPRLDWPILKHLLQVGIWLALKAKARVLFVFADRTVITIFLGTTMLGYYALAGSLILPFSILIRDFTSVSKTFLYEHLGAVSEALEARSFCLSTITLCSFLSSFSIGIIWLAAPPLFHLFLPKYLPGLNALSILALTIYADAVIILPYSLLSSAKVNLQQASTYAYAAGAAINVTASLVLIRFDYGIAGVAVGSAIANLSLVVFGFVLSRPFLFVGHREEFRFYGFITFPLLYSLVLAAGLTRVFGDWGQSLTGASVRLAAFVIAFLPCLIIAVRSAGLFAQLRLFLARRNGVTPP